MNTHDMKELIELNKLIEQHSKWYGKGRESIIKGDYLFRPSCYLEVKKELNRFEKAHQEWIYFNLTKLRRREELQKKWVTLFKSNPKIASELVKKVIKD